MRLGRRRSRAADRHAQPIAGVGVTSDVAAGAISRVSRRLAAILGLATLAFAGSSLAQTAPHSSTQDGGYAVTRWQTRVPAPPGRVGWKNTDHERRVGNTDATTGMSYSADLTLGGFVNKCPTFDGKVPGDFEFMLNATQVESTGSQPTDHAKLASARIEARLNDDATIRELEMQGSFVSVGGGVRSGTAPFRRTFRLNQAGEPDFDALMEAVTVTGDMAIAALMWNASMVYKSAESGWLKPDECVEFEFDPPSETQALGPNESKRVRTTLRTKEGKQPVPRAHMEGRPLNQIGQLAPRDGDSRDDGQLPFNYTASANPKKGHGYEVAALSRAGRAKGEWRIVEPGFKGKFSYTDSGELGPMRNVFKVTGDLLWTPEERDPPSPPTFGGTKSSFFRPSAGEFTVEVEFNNRALGGPAVCKGNGRKTFPIASLARNALRHMLLEIADDGRYKLTLVIPDTPDPFPPWDFDAECVFPNARSSEKQAVRNVAVVLGMQQGTLNADQGIVGHLASPIRRGPRSITGDWSFVRVKPSP